MKKFLISLLPKKTKWELIDIYFFDSSTYTVQVRMNLKTGFKQFRVTKIINYSYCIPTKITVADVNHLVTKDN